MNTEQLVWLAVSETQRANGLQNEVDTVGTTADGWRRASVWHDTAKREPLAVSDSRTYASDSTALAPLESLSMGASERGNTLDLRSDGGTWRAWELLHNLALGWAKSLGSETCDDTASDLWTEYHTHMKAVHGPGFLVPIAHLRHALRQRLTDAYRRHKAESLDVLLDTPNGALVGAINSMEWDTVQREVLRPIVASLPEKIRNYGAALACGYRLSAKQDMTLRNWRRAATAKQMHRQSVLVGGLTDKDRKRISDRHRATVTDNTPTPAPYL